jgi:heme-degrading monooxygenase HmoA
MAARPTGPMDVGEPFIALVIYPTTPDAQAAQAERLQGFSAQRIRLLPGFVRAQIFVSEDGVSLVTLTEWRDRESFQAFRDSEFGRAAILLAAELHPKAYWLRQRAVVEAPS